MDNPRFNVGDEVVALKSVGWEYLAPITRGVVYPVINVWYCPKCKAQSINIGFSTMYDDGRCECGKMSPTNGIAYSPSQFFALLQNMTEQIEQALEEPIHAHRH